MSTTIQMMLCRHLYIKENEITLVCSKCGKVKSIPCGHQWKVYAKSECKEKSNRTFGYREYELDTLIYEKCGTIKQIEV